MPVHVFLFRFWYLCLDSLNTLLVNLLGFIFSSVHKRVSKGVYAWCICTQTSLAGRHIRSLLFSGLFPEPLLVLIIVVGLVEVTVQIKEVSRFIYLYRHSA